MNLSDNPRLRLVTLCALYVSQGIPFGFVTITLAAYLSKRGMDEHVIGAIGALVSVPWALKWLWGPMIDRFGFLPMGRRRPWILLAQTFMVLTIGAMIAIPDLVTGVMALAWMVLIHNVFASLQDVSVDALAVDLLREEERGRANGLMYGSSYGGTFLGGAGLGAVLTCYGSLRVALIVQIVLLASIMLLPLLLRERAGERLLPWTKGRSMAPVRFDSAASLGELFAPLARAFSLRSTVLGAVLALGVKIASGVSVTMAVVFLIQRYQWSEAEYIAVNGNYGVWLGLAGSICGGFMADRLGARRLAGIATVLLGLVYIGFSCMQSYWSCKAFVTGFLLVQETLLSILSVSLFALFMGISWPVVAATQFTAYMALLNLSEAFGKRITGPLRDTMSVSEVYFYIGLLQIGLVLLLPLIDPHQTRRVLGDGTAHDSNQ